MSDDRMDSVSLQGRILFGCGIVLGVCLGFAAGHVAVWSRISPSADSLQNPFVDETSGHVHSSNNVESELPFVGERPNPSQHGSVPGPFFAAAARRLKTPTEEASLQSQRVRVATDTSPNAPVPDALPFSNAAPIDEETQLREQVTRTIIAQELPQSTEQEQEIWFDVLRGMEAADVKGILRMRKHVGDDPASAFGMLRAEPNIATPAPSRRLVKNADTNNNMWSATLEGLRRIREVHLHNLANAQTIGFIRHVPVTREADSSSGERGSQLVRVELDRLPQHPLHTGRMLDVGISGYGFFRVRHNDETRLTRCGRLDINEDRQLVLATTEQPWRLEPSIEVPEDVNMIVFHPNGEVWGKAGQATEEALLGTIELMTVDEPWRLEAVGDGLYRTTEESGPIHEAPDGVKLEWRSILMFASAHVEEEMAGLNRVTRLIEEMTNGTSTP